MSTSKRKYPTFKALAAAFKSGELDRKRYYISMDKGGTDLTLRYRGGLKESDASIDAKCDECYGWFVRDEGSETVEELLNEMGIPCEHC